MSLLGTFATRTFQRKRGRGTKVVNWAVTEARFSYWAGWMTKRAVAVIKKLAGSWLVSLAYFKLATALARSPIKAASLDRSSQI